VNETQVSLADHTVERATSAFAAKSDQWVERVKLPGACSSFPIMENFRSGFLRWPLVPVGSPRSAGQALVLSFNYHDFMTFRQESPESSIKSPNEVDNK
jgi:hypothetical protein